MGGLAPSVPLILMAASIRYIIDSGGVTDTILHAAAEPLRLVCLEKPFLVKPNDEETQALTGLPVDTPVQVALAAVELRKMGAQNVVISLGKTGTLLQTPEATWIVHPPAIKEKKPTGASDAMLAVWCGRWQKGYAIKRSPELGRGQPEWNGRCVTGSDNGTQVAVLIEALEVPLDK